MTAFNKNWHLKKSRGIVSASSDMIGWSLKQNVETIFQEEIFENVFLCAIFDGDASQIIRDIFQDYDWGGVFQEQLTQYSKRENDNFEKTMSNILAKTNNKFYEVCLEQLKSKIYDWCQDNAENAGELQIIQSLNKLTKCMIILLTTEPSDVDLLKILQEYTACVNVIASRSSKNHVDQTYHKFLLMIKSSYKNLRRISDDSFNTLDKNFRDFCIKVCTDTDLFYAAAAVNDYMINLIENDVQRNTKRETYVLDEACKILEKQGIHFDYKENNVHEKGEPQIDAEAIPNIPNESINKNFFSRMVPGHRIRLQTYTLNTDSFRFLQIPQKDHTQKKHDAEEKQRWPKFIQEYEEAQKKNLQKSQTDGFGDKLILGNDTRIIFSGAMALFTFLDIENKSIINVNMGNSLSVLKTEKSMLPLNNQLDFRREDERERFTKAQNTDFYLQESFSYSDSSMYRDGFSLRFSRAFGYFFHGINTDAEFSVTQLGKDAQSIIIGCNGVWEKMSIKTVADIFDFFYFKKTNPQPLQEQEEQSKGYTKPLGLVNMQVEQLDKTENRHSKLQVKMEDLSRLDISGIDDEQRLILSLAQMQNQALTSRRRLRVICVDVRLLVENLENDQTKILRFSQNIKQENYDSIFEPWKEGRDVDKNLISWLGKDKAAYIGMPYVKKFSDGRQKKQGLPTTQPLSTEAIDDKELNQIDIPQIALREPSYTKIVLFLFVAAMIMFIVFFILV